MRKDNKLTANKNAYFLKTLVVLNKNNIFIRKLHKLLVVSSIWGKKRALEPMSIKKFRGI